MIAFQEYDFNLPKIRKEAKVFNLITRHSYRIYGLKCGVGNPLIWIKGPPGKFPFPQIKRFFESNRLSCQVSSDENYGVGPISIGLRRDLRDHVVLTACIVKTIIYAMERKISLKREFPIPGIPKFKVED